MKGVKGRPKLPPKEPTPEQAAWLKKYFKMFTAIDLQKKMEISERTLRDYMNYLGLKKKRGPVNPKKREAAPPPPPKQIIRFKPQPKQQRLRADHTNMTREQRIDYWINYPI